MNYINLVCESLNEFILYCIIDQIVSDDNLLKIRKKYMRIHKIFDTY